MSQVGAEHTHGKWGITHTHPHEHSADKPCAEMRAHVHHLTVFDAIEMKVTHHTAVRTKRGPYKKKEEGPLLRQYSGLITLEETDHGVVITVTQR